MKPTRLLPEAIRELEDTARSIDRDRPGWGDKLYAAVFDGST